VVYGATGAELALLGFNFDHVDEIRTVVIADFEFVYKLNFCLRFKDELVDCFYYVLVSDFVIVSLQFSEMV